jgi:predicted aspartyl protease
MIRGIVNDHYEPIARLTIRGQDGSELEVEAVIDTGFNSYLALPAAMVDALDLPRHSAGTATLADGSEVTFDIFAADWRSILLSVIGNEPLVGMRLLGGHKLTIAVNPGGIVEVVRL